MRLFTILLLACALSAQALEIPPIPEGVSEGYAEFLPSDELVEKITNQDVFSDAQINKSVDEWIVSVIDEVPLLSEIEIAHFSYVVGEVSSAPGVTKGFSRRGRVLGSSTYTKEQWVNETVVLWVIKAEDDEVFVNRWVAKMPSDIELFQNRFGELSLAEQFEWAAKAHQAGCRSKPFLKWARELKTAVQRGK